MVHDNIVYCCFLPDFYYVFKCKHTILKFTDIVEPKPETAINNTVLYTSYQKKVHLVIAPHS
jgi:hypothetical protein